MKIGILTLPLTNNYGGHLQAWALQTFLKCKGHEPILLDIRQSGERNYKFFLHIKRLIAFLIKYLPGKRNYHYFDYKKYQELNFKQFRDREFIKTRSIHGKNALKKVFHNEEFDAIIVGSDQVWRKWNMIPLDIYFLSWLHLSVKKVGYAISFGKNQWELDKQETIKYSKWAKEFNGLSMREIDGVRMTKDYLGMDSELVLDPTMLLDGDDYKHLYKNHLDNSKNGVFYYFLDNTVKKKKILSVCSERFGKAAFEVMPKVRWFDAMSKYKETDYIYPPIGEWLSAFVTSSFVITDSFHGTVFSIIFNKPFIVLGNEYRGMSRINSLLEMFDLKNRLVADDDITAVTKLISTPIDWDRVNKKREEWKNVSTSFIEKNIPSSI